jgi:hypothetical protein
MAKSLFAKVPNTPKLRQVRSDSKTDILANRFKYLMRHRMLTVMHELRTKAIHTHALYIRREDTEGLLTP